MKILRWYQKWMLLYCLTKANPLLFVKMRLGKTLVVIRWLSAMFTGKHFILVVAPFSALYSWQEELQDEGECCVCLLEGMKQKRIALLERTLTSNNSGSTWVLVNPEAYRAFDIAAAAQWSVIVFDECTYLRNTRSSLYQYWSNAHAAIKVGMTGTPAPEGDHEYFGVCKLIEPDTFLEGSYYQFERANFGILPNHKRMTNARGANYISSRLAKYAYFLTRQDVNLGGETIEQIRYVKMPDKTRAIYKRVEKEFLLELPTEIKTTIFAMTKYIWLRHLCSGVIEQQQLDTAKADILIDLLSGELAGEKVIIWCHFIADLKVVQAAIMKHFKKEVDIVCGSVTPNRRNAIKKAFLSGEIDWFVCQPSCYRFGADFSECDTMIYYCLPDSGLTWEQSRDRTIDVSKRGSKHVIYLLTKDTVEVDIQKALVKKENRQALTRRMVASIQKRNKL